MSDTVVSRLTPPGVGAIATVEVSGPRAWELARQLFTPAGKPLPESPELNRFWFGTLGRDEVVLAARGFAVEVHCHGGRRVVRWVIDQFLANGCIEERNPRPSGEGFELLQRAPTLRTASIILDQMCGAFANEVRRLLALLESDPGATAQPLRTLTYFGNTVGRHLIEPWKVVVAGPPNVGKSSLVNALAGYQRSVVSEVAGTTRDAVSVRTAFDGWPFELVDTAGLREAVGLEAEGIERAERELARADLVVWVLDGTAPEPTWPLGPFPLSQPHWFVINKADQPLAGWTRTEADDVPVVSATTGEGLSGLVDAILTCTVGLPEFEGIKPIAFTPQLADLVDAAHAALRAGRIDKAASLLREALAAAE